jgi:GNAT superfamily N-acetyltransferase
MMLPAWHEEPINKKHDREGFDCGEDALNEFLRRHARRSHELGGAKTFLAIDNAHNQTILGFYSLSTASVAYARTPEIIRRGLARHDVPGFRLARLAVDRNLQGQGLGGQLLLAAGRRCLLASAEVGGVVLVIDVVCQLRCCVSAGRALISAAAPCHDRGCAEKGGKTLTFR